jgi:hypothetical protein
MEKLLEVITPWLTIILIISLLVTICTFIVICINVVKNKENSTSVWSFNSTKLFLVAVIVLLSGIFLFSYKSHFIAGEIETMLRDKSVTIEIENKIYEDKDRFIQEFFNRSQTKLSGSRPTETTNIQIITSEKGVNLQFKRDSRDQNLYWVFEPKTSTKLGYVTTDILDYIKK